MSTSDEQPLTRRQIRERERAREAGRAVAEGTAGGAPAEAGTPGAAGVPASTPAPAAAVPASAPESTSADAAPPVPASTPTPPPASVAGPDGLTRRQMRAQRAEQDGPSAPVPLQAPGPEPRRRLVDALSTVDEIVAPLDESAPASARRPAGDASSVVPATSGPDATDRDDAGRDDASSDDAAGDERAPGPRRTGQPGAASSGPASSAPAAAPSVFPLDLASGGSATVSPGSAPQAAGAAGSAAAAAEPAPASVPEPSGFVPPVGHWTTQSDEPDDDTAPGRALGTHTGQTNALILTDQQVADVTGALNATGEIIITGSIDLPRSLGATGSQARIDNSDIDRLLEQGDAESAETDAAPVRASRAISTHTSTRSVVLAASQPASSKLPLILGIGGGVLGAGIIGVVIAGFATGILGG
jgi:hypothetical protein